MAAPVVFFEIGSKDAAALAGFYGDVLGWRFAELGAARTIVGGHEGGPAGMLNALGHPPETYVMVYAQVEDLAVALAQVAQSGGAKLVGPHPLPDGRHFAWVRDPAGNLLGLVTPPPTAG
jgi:predicted enzyme related to lactoylglutathione lyase